MDLIKIKGVRIVLGLGCSLLHAFHSQSSFGKGGFRSLQRATRQAAMESTGHVRTAVAYVSAPTKPVVADSIRQGIQVEVWSHPICSPACSSPIRKLRADHSARLHACSGYPKPLLF